MSFGIKLKKSLIRYSDLQKRIWITNLKFFSFQDDTTHVLEWNITRLNDTKQTPSIRITATDSMNATSEYWPTIRYCDCVRFDECKSNMGYMQNSMTGVFNIFA